MDQLPVHRHRKRQIPARREANGQVFAQRPADVRILVHQNAKIQIFVKRYANFQMLAQRDATAQAFVRRQETKRVLACQKAKKQIPRLRETPLSLGGFPAYPTPAGCERNPCFGGMAHRRRIHPRFAHGHNFRRYNPPRKKTAFRTGQTHPDQIQPGKSASRFP